MSGSTIFDMLDVVSENSKYLKKCNCRIKICAACKENLDIETNKHSVNRKCCGCIFKHFPPQLGQQGKCVDGPCFELPENSTLMIYMLIEDRINKVFKNKRKDISYHTEQLERMRAQNFKNNSAAHIYDD